MKQLDFRHWIKLSDALLQARACLNDWSMAGRAVLHALCGGDLAAVCERFSYVTDVVDSDEFSESVFPMGVLPVGVERAACKWQQIDAWYWKKMVESPDWGANFAYLDCDNGRIEFVGIIVSKSDVNTLWPPHTVDVPSISPNNRNTADEIREATHTEVVSAIKGVAGSLASNQKLKELEWFRLVKDLLAPHKVPHKGCWRPAWKEAKDDQAVAVHLLKRGQKCADSQARKRRS